MCWNKVWKVKKIQGRRWKTQHKSNCGVSFQMFTSQQTDHPMATPQPQTLMVVNPSVGNPSGFYHCSLCNYRTGTKEELNNHMRQHTDGWLHACPHCDYKTRRSNDLKRHVISRHEGSILRPYRCSFCPYRTTCSSYLQQHLNTKHQNHSRHSSLPIYPSSEPSFHPKQWWNFLEVLFLGDANVMTPYTNKITTFIMLTCVFWILYTVL